MIAFVVFHILGICYVDWVCKFFLLVLHFVVALVFAILKLCMKNSIFIWNFGQMGLLVFEGGAGM